MTADQVLIAVAPWVGVVIGYFVLPHLFGRRR